jgi:hypothetical protein
MSRTVETLAEAMKYNDKRWLSMGARVDYGFLNLEESVVKIDGRLVHADDLLFRFYRTIYDRKVGKDKESIKAWKSELHDNCLNGLLHLYLDEWFLANDAENRMWKLFKEKGWKVTNPYPLGGDDDDDDDY